MPGTAARDRLFAAIAAEADAAPSVGASLNVMVAEFAAGGRVAAALGLPLWPHVS